MRVAVIGAGPAGLACALTLERLGILPDVFEKGDRVGYPVAMVQSLLGISHPWLGEQLTFLREELGLAIRPLSRLERVIYHCPGVRQEVAGRHGYLILRGRDEGSLERQLTGLLATRIKFCHWAEAGQLAGQYDYVVVADGSGRTARQAGVWQRSLRAMVRGAQVLGEFDPCTAEVYFDTVYAGRGYGSLVPFDSRRAELTLQLVPGPGDKMDHSWRVFLAREGLVFDVNTRFDLVFAAGRVTRHQIGNVLLVGNAGGLVEPLLGLGILAALVSGVLAARAIAGQGDYGRLLAAYAKRQDEFIAARAGFNCLDQIGITRLVGLLGLPLANRVFPTGQLDVIHLMQPWLTGSATDDNEVGPGR